ncbi:hypothetical protein EV359DRAFT_68350 [Lentinula novae-zelandiae]|nr:hypothetical protein EV359DRAFT_68350 [Lentinula novae-zelandiae]
MSTVSIISPSPILDLNDLKLSVNDQHLGNLLNLFTLSPLHRTDIAKRIWAAANLFIPGISHGPLPRNIDTLKLWEVGMDYPKEIDFIEEYIDRSNPISYPATLEQTVRNFYEFRGLVERLVDWVTICQFKTFKRKEAGLSTSWSWDSTWSEYELLYPRNIGHIPYQPCSPIMDPRLAITSSAPGNTSSPTSNVSEAIRADAMILHPTTSHYSAHYPGFDAYTGMPLPEIENCENQETCSRGLHTDFEMMSLE